MHDSMEVFHSVQQHLGLTDSRYSASTQSELFLFVSVDLEFNLRCITQLGISVFDPQTLKSLKSTELRNPQPISNEFPISSVLYSTKTSRYQERRRKPSHFGQKYTLVPERLQPILEEVLTPNDEQGNPRGVVLVGHNIAKDVEVIKNNCGLDISQSITSVRAILDTQHISQTVLKSKERLSLKRLLVALKLEYVGLHNAAHDSRYTLRALLLMSCMTARRRCFTTLPVDQDAEKKRRLALLEEIARFHRSREKISWCSNSPRVKFEGNPDILDWEYDDEDVDDGGILAGIIREQGSTFVFDSIQS